MSKPARKKIVVNLAEYDHRAPITNSVCESSTEPITKLSCESPVFVQESDSSTPSTEIKGETSVKKASSKSATKSVKIQKEPKTPKTSKPPKTPKTPKPPKTPKTPKPPKPPLNLIYSERNKFEIGIDEAGRGPLFGRLYVAGVILPKDGSIDPSNIRDSKTLSAKKRTEMAEYIKTNALSYHIYYAEPNVIDKINIRQAVLQGMRQCILENRKKILAYMATKTPMKSDNPTELIDYDHEFFALIDGDDFAPCMHYDDSTEEYSEIPHAKFIGGDNQYLAIAAASILAKVAHDEHIHQLCTKHPQLVERYGMNTHMGYGTKKHLQGIAEHGITQYHRRSYGCCKHANLNVV